MSYRVLLLTGSLRAQSTNTAALRTLLSLPHAGISGTIYEGLDLLPAFNPDQDDDRLPTAVLDLREHIRGSDALVISTPEYAGALPGSFKNLLDWTIGDSREGSIYNKPVAWLNVSPRGAAGAHAELRTVLGYAHAAIVEPACIAVPVTQTMIEADGLISDPGILEQLVDLADQLTGGLTRIGV